MERTYIFYRPQDFLLYLGSLAIVGVVGWLAFAGYGHAQVLLAAGLGYMAATFVLKRGATFDWETFPLIARGILSYPERVLRSLGQKWVRRLRELLIFALVISVEALFKRHAGDNSAWLRPFPYAATVFVAFVVVSLFRTAVFLSHLGRLPLIREVLDSSEWRRELKGLSTWNHAVHGYVTGLISHASSFMPALIFWHLTSPTYLREALLVAGVSIQWGIQARRLRERLGVGLSVRSFAASWALEAAHAVQDYDAAVISRTHGEDHKSRFFFSVFHGHHHDAIPSAMIASGETGFVESIERAMVGGTFLNSAILLAASNALYTCVDMTTHQYIPGIFPYSGSVIDTQVHHVAHHYGSLRPLGLGGVPSYKADVDNGYKLDNARVRWYLRLVKLNETLSDEQYAMFVSIDDFDARARELYRRSFFAPSV
jgi:hypothetical protein